ncbi:hypothetical protein N7478_008398 [Penicillium angulare]|uniref:uncharacterized protein n=1 Tax=Penicillium angulare TaxID=116970 RepID=UPI002540051C|nr:uncharacterized protein N7478_008398 [Penicillium angulare]KAJ5273273.1 hypothetical protein N7478_008398 [Penicillium angulare]
MTIHTPGNDSQLLVVNGQISKESLQSAQRNIFIAVMGMTGAGKSTFISHCTDTKVEISDPSALQSCTQEVQVYRCKGFPPHTNVFLVDTPGFDDTNRKDTDILKEIATWLTTTYKNAIHLSGILYLHRISDNRMGGCAHRNLIMFKKLCGPEGVKNVIFLTTFWERVEAAVGETREKTLMTTEDFWGYFVDRGAQVQRHWNTDISATTAIQNFIPSDTAKPPEEIKLAIQTEMVDSHKDLDQTSAGQELQSELQKEREKMQQELIERAREIQEEKDQEMRDILRADQEKQAKELQRRDADIQELKISMERMHEKKLKQLEERLLEQETEVRRQREEFEQKMRQKEREQLSQLENERHRHREVVEQMMQQYQESFQSMQGQSNRAVENLTQQIKDLKTSDMQCHDCYHTFKSASELFDHKQTKHSQFAYSTSKEVEIEDNVSNDGSAGWGSTKATVSTPSDYGEDGYVDPYLTCLACGTSFSNRLDLFKHLERFQHGRDLATGKPEKYGMPPGYKIPKVDSWLTCLACKKKFFDRDDLFEHIEKFQHGRDLITGKPEKYKRPFWY